MRPVSARRRVVLTTALALLTTTAVALPAGAEKVQTEGTAQFFYTSWTELDPDDVLGLPGNVHVGFLSGWNDQYGTYFYGNVTDFECDEGEVPGGGHDVVEGIAAQGMKTARNAEQDAIDAIIDSGAKIIKGATVISEIQSQLNDDLPEFVEDEIPTCDYIQDRFLDGTGTVTFTVDTKAAIATVEGTLTVTGGGHGEPGPVLGMPPINLTISGGEWQKYEYSSSYWGQDYKYSDWSNGTSFNDGTVTGAIGAMGFDDDPDDISYGGFGSNRYRTVEQIRG